MRLSVSQSSEQPCGDRTCDDDNCAEVVALLEREAAQTGATLVIVTHDGRLKEKFTHRISLQPQRP